MQSTYSTIVSFLTSVHVAQSAARVLGVVSGISFGTFVAGFMNPRLSAQRNGALQLGILSSLGAAYCFAPVSFGHLIKETWGIGEIVAIVAIGSWGVLQTAYAGFSSMDLVSWVKFDNPPNGDFYTNVKQPPMASSRTGPRTLCFSILSIRTACG